MFYAIGFIILIGLLWTISDIVSKSLENKRNEQRTDFEDLPENIKKGLRGG